MREILIEPLFKLYLWASNMTDSEYWIHIEEVIKDKNTWEKRHEKFISKKETMTNPQTDWEKKKVVLTFYTGVAGQEIVLNSRVIERIDQGADVEELLIHVKMPSKDTKEFRDALTTVADTAREDERNRIDLDFKLFAAGLPEKMIFKKENLIYLMQKLLNTQALQQDTKE